MSPLFTSAGPLLYKGVLSSLYTAWFPLLLRGDWIYFVQSLFVLLASFTQIFLRLDLLLSVGKKTRTAVVCNDPFPVMVTRPVSDLILLG